MTATLQVPARTRAWAGASAALVLFDAVATAAVVRAPAQEANPLLAALMASVGVGAALVLRALFGLALLGLLLALARRHRPAAEALVVSALVHAAVAAWHVLGPLQAAAAG